MLFNTPIFLFVFLPASLALYYVTRKFGFDKYFLIAASLVFYGYWDPRLLPLLLASIVANWLIAGASLRFGRKEFWIFLGVASNLVLLGVFKYTNFLAATISDLFALEQRRWDIVLPLAISFFTFHQISYLVDIKRGDKHFYNFFDYLLYIVFFPHLIAGPIVRHNEFIYQIERARTHPAIFEAIGRGTAMFVIGLAKKIWLADPLARVVDPIFTQASKGAIQWNDAWMATIGFALQIYFDFSGYTDMAIGLSLMFGYALPQNFNAPYAATSIIEFWRRWHMTLSRFLRDYLYIPLGGNRYGPHRQKLALMLTMLLGGLWHGANWTFVVWGGLHGLGLAINHQWRAAGLRMPITLAWLLTFVFAAICFAIFRAENLQQAWHIVSSLLPNSTGYGLISPYSASLLLAALGFAVLGPTNHDIAHVKVRPSAWVPAGLAVALVCSIVMILGSDHYAPFIYFQF